MSESILTTEQTAKPEAKSDVAGWIRFILLLIGIYLVFTYVLSLSIIDGDSMNPTLETNGVLLTLGMFNQPEAGDVIVFESEYGFSVIKRVIGMPGDTVAIQSGTVFVNGEALAETYTTGISDDMEAVQVIEGSYFVLGDNRTPGESLDSRSTEVGLVLEQDVKGEVLLSLFPFKWSMK